MTEQPYSGLLGTFPYAYRMSDSRLFRSYVLLGGLFALLVALLFVFALIVVTFRTLGGGGGTLTFSRAFVLLVGILVVLPLVAPVILVARRHRRSGSDSRYDTALAAGGFLFIGSLYVAVIVSTPPAQQEAPPELLAPVVGFLYSQSRVAGLLPPLAAGLLLLALHQYLD